MPTGFLLSGAFIGSEIRQRQDGTAQLVVSVAVGINSYLVNMSQIYDVSKYNFGDDVLIKCRPIVTKSGSLWILDGQFV